MFSAIVRLGNTFSVCGTKPTPRETSLSARRFVMSCPLSVSLPEWMCTRPNSDLSNVDLPAPFGPMMPTISPSCSVSEAPFKMLTPGR